MNKNTSKRVRVEEYILKLMTQFDTFGGNNVDRYTRLFKSMSDKRFDEFMNALKAKQTQISAILPNNMSSMTTNKVIAIAKKRGVVLFSKINFHDMHTGRPYKTAYPVMVVALPVRRLSQYLFHKISLPDGDSHINPISGQVIPPDKGAALSSIETQILASKGLSVGIVELLKVRGGDMNAYKTMRLTIEEQGDVSLNDIPLSGRPRSAITVKSYLHAMMIDSNI